MAAPKGIRKASKVASVIKSKTLHTDDLAPRDVVTTSEPLSLSNVVSKIAMPETEDVVLAGDIDKQYAAQLAFNEEMVEITIAEDASEFPVDPVGMSNNGKQIFVKRGEPTKIRRKFVESLCNPLVRVATKKVKNNLDEDATVLQQTRSLQYPFSLNDANPLGKVWLRQLLSRG